MRNKNKKAEVPAKTKEKKSETLPKPMTKRLEVLAMREKYHRFELIVDRGQRDLDKMFGIWSPPPFTPDEMRELFFITLSDSRWLVASGLLLVEHRWVIAFVICKKGNGTRGVSSAFCQEPLGCCAPASENRNVKETCIGEGNSYFKWRMLYAGYVEQIGVSRWCSAMFHRALCTI